MCDENFNVIDPNFFLPKEDIFSVFLNAGENKNNEPMSQTLDQMFKTDNNMNILNNFLESTINIFSGKNQDNSISYNGEFPHTKSLNDLLGNKRKDTLASSEHSREATDGDNYEQVNNIALGVGINKIINKTQARMKRKKESYSDKFGEASSESSDSKKMLFKTFKGEEEGPDDMKKMMRQMKNRLSARKCRQKKKSYVQNLESKVMDLQIELDKYKNAQRKEKQTEGMIASMESKEKEISQMNASHKKKIENCKKEYCNVQKTLVTDLFKKMIKNLTPINYKMLSGKFLKLREFESSDTFEKVVTKIDENIEILGQLYNCNNVTTVEIEVNCVNGLNSVNKALKNVNEGLSLPYKLYEFYSNLKSITAFFKDAFLDKLEN